MSAHIAHSGAWGLAIVIASWVFYRYFAPHGWRERYRAHQAGRLASVGLYGLGRHPQYMGPFVGLFGEGVVHWPTVFSVTLFPIILLTYTRLAYREERGMIAKFGNQYEQYRRRVPMFFPGRYGWRGLIEEARP